VDLPSPADRIGVASSILKIRAMGRARGLLIALWPCRNLRAKSADLKNILFQ
jgi:hypothetical protein